MTEPTTEPGKWLVAEYARTPGDPKWYPGLGLESTVIAIEAEAFASLDARYAAQLNLTIKANSTIEDLREELHAAHEHRRVVEEYMAAPDPAPLDVERLAAGLHRYFEACDGGCPHDEGYGDTEGKCKDAAVFLAAIEGSKP